jgi:hypothetical protein
MSKSNGKISLCESKGCAFKCCDFNQMVHILLYPGEIEEAKGQGLSLTHLEVIDPNFHGGTRVRCRAKDTATCDSGYKPLDCKSYPFFPKLSAPIVNGDVTDGEITITKGSECPIARHEIPFHEVFVRDLWKKQIAQKPEIAIWLRAAGLTPIDLFDSEIYE